MKIDVFIPGALVRRIEASLGRLNLSRDQFFAIAAREYLARQRAVGNATDAWNKALAAAGQPGLDAAAFALQRRSKVVIRAALSQTNRGRRA